MHIILAHENADFDALASLLGASKLFPAATPVLPRRVNRNGEAFLALYGAELPLTPPQELPNEAITHVTLVDTQSLVRLKGMVDDVKVDIIDHHERDPELPADWTFSGEQLGATTTLLSEELSARSLRLTSIEATLLLLGIYEDTGSLTYKSTTDRDLRAAAWLLEEGANLEVVDKFIHHPLAPSQRELYEQLLERSETHTIEGHSIIIATAQAPSFEEEISTLAHKLRELMEPSALFVLVALDGRVQLVARSTTDDIDVAEIAEHFGGGGHTRASAALIRDRSLEMIHDELATMLPRVVRPSATVGQIMSRGVQILSPADTIEVAAKRMRRTGHEGYPVVEDGKVIGLLTRRAVDRAMQFKMADAPVTQVMKAGHVTVSIDDSIPTLQQQMIETGWGQIPVVEEGEIVGVVTRTDLITLWGTPPQSSRQQEMVDLLEKALAPPVLALVRQVSEEANELGFVPYFVGGLVRDLLLNQSIVDIDLVIEGDAIKLAHHLADKLGGRVIPHRRFGTAKWLLSDKLWQATARQAPGDDLPPSIDFASARTEFYTHPTALPQVARSSIKQDLHRRDFTINTLAIRLDPDHWGELLDFYGGESDLEEGVIRVLHSLSFVDDPTRMLRAARLESRLGFTLDPRSEELIADAVPLLKRVSGDRIRRELEQIFEEPEPEQTLSRLDDLGILKQIHPGLRCDRWLRDRYESLRHRLQPSAWELTAEDLKFLHLALLVYRLDLAAIEALIERLNIASGEANDLRAIAAVRRDLPRLGKARRSSAIYHLLTPYAGRVLATAYLATGRRRLKKRMRRYQESLRHVEPELTGDDLKAMGLRPSPLFGRLLAELRNARLDGKVATRQEEEALLETLLEKEEIDVSDHRS